MVDNTRFSAGTADGDTYGSDDIAGIKFARMKLIHGADGTNDGDVANANPLPIKITDGTDVALVTAGGLLQVDASGATVPVSNAGLTELAAAINASSQMDVNIAASAATVAVSNAGITTIAGAVSGTEMQVDVVAALPAGTNAIGKLAANSGVDIGDTDVTSVVPGTGATNLGKAEDGAHTSGDVGVMALGVRTDTPNAARGDTDLDYVPIATYRTGAVRVAPIEEDFAALGSNHVKKYYANTGATTDGIVWSPAAGKRWYVTSLHFTTSAAATVTFEDDLAGGDSIVFAGDYAANSGAAISFPVPLFSGEDAADLLVTTTAGNIKVTCVGYEI